MLLLSSPHFQEVSYGFSLNSVLMLFQLAAFVLSLFQNLHTFSCFYGNKFHPHAKTRRNVVIVSPASMKV